LNDFTAAATKVLEKKKKLAPEELATMEAALEKITAVFLRFPDVVQSMQQKEPSFFRIIAPWLEARTLLAQALLQHARQKRAESAADP
jgi:hypothetical protein